MPNMPLSQPPPKPANWWKTVPGQLAVVTMIFGAIFILFGLMGAFGPLAGR